VASGARKWQWSDRIERLIRQAFPDAHVIVVDMAGMATFAARIASEAFKGKEAGSSSKANPGWV